MACTHCRQSQTPENRNRPCPVRAGVGHAWLHARWVNPVHELEEYPWP